MFSMRGFILGAGGALTLALMVPGVAAAARVGPSCTPARLDNSALQAGAVTVSPLAGSRDAAAQTQISFLGVTARDIGSVSVLGSRTGRHRGRLLAYSEGDGASFVPSRPFAQGELVTVRARVRVGDSERALLDRFEIAYADHVATSPRKRRRGNAAEVQSFHSLPDVHPPTVTVTAQFTAVAAGDMFIAPYEGPGQTGPMILAPSGELLWFSPLPTNMVAADVQVQEYEGKHVLTWWQGRVNDGFGLGEDVIADGTYTDIAHVRAGNGLRADLHELQMTPQGTALITAYHPILCDLSSAGGRAYGGVVDGALQEIDVRTGLVMYEWTSIDHVALENSYEPALPLTTGTGVPFDYFHINSISLDRDGSLLVSSRNTWALYKLNASTGQIIWRLGGKHSSFKMGPGTGVAWQHDSRELPDGSISIFDNGAAPAAHPQSRGIVISLNQEARTATLVTRLTHTPPLVAESQGNVQELAGGDWFVGWGAEPYFSEFGPEGQLLFDAHLPAGSESYRDFRFPWTGTPAQPPVFAFQLGAAGAPSTVYASWNGATLVTAWRLLAGANAASLATVAQVPRGGFETAIPVPAAAGGPVVEVQALGAEGQVLGTSAPAVESALG
jgi:hypothetical protein